MTKHEAAERPGRSKILAIGLALLVLAAVVFFMIPGEWGSGGEGPVVSAGGVAPAVPGGIPDREESDAALARPAASKGEIVVFVMDPTGAPASGAKGQARSASGETILRGNADGQGRIVFTGVTGDGTWTVGARDNESMPVFRGGVRAGDTVTLRLAGITEVVIEVRDGDGHRVENVVVEARPVFEGVGDLPPWVLAMKGPGGPGAPTAPHVVSPFPRTRGIARASLDGAVIAVAEFEPPAEGPARVTLVAEGGSVIRGLVMDETGARLPGIEIVAEGEGVDARCVTIADGTFALRVAEGARVTVTAREPWDRTRNQIALTDITSPAEGIEFRMPLSPTSPCFSTVIFTDPAGQPVREGAGVVRRAEDGAEVSSFAASSITDGVVRTIHEEPGSYYLELRSRDGWLRTEPFQVRRGATTDLGTLRAQAGATFVGRLLRPDGTAPDGLHLRLADRTLPELGYEPRTGAFRVGGLPPGENTLVAEFPGCDPRTLTAHVGAGEIRDFGAIRLTAASGTVKGVLQGRRPAGELSATLTPLTGRSAGRTLGPVSVDDAGNFIFRAVPAGSWRPVIARGAPQGMGSEILSGVMGPTVELDPGGQVEVAIPELK